MAFVCSCAVVSDDEVVRAIDAGAHTVAEVGEACDAGTGCQICHETIRQLIRERTGVPASEPVA